MTRAPSRVIYCHLKTQSLTGISINDSGYRVYKGAALRGSLGAHQGFRLMTEGGAHVIYCHLETQSGTGIWINDTDPRAYKGRSAERRR